MSVPVQYNIFYKLAGIIQNENKNLLYLYHMFECICFILSFFLYNENTKHVWLYVSSTFRP